jgi:hypothetical protein
MKRICIALLLLGLVLATTPAAFADTLKLKDGSKLEGTVNKMEDGKLYITVGKESRVIEMSDIAGMEFTAGKAEAMDLAKDLELMDKSADEIRKLLGQIEGYWLLREPIEGKDEAGWNAAKVSFEQPVREYQEILNGFYFHILARVDEYNALMKKASDVYVGIKGIRIGSALIPVELEELPLTRYVPGAWYTKIFNDGYNTGVADAESRRNDPRRDRQ